MVTTLKTGLRPSSLAIDPLGNLYVISTGPSELELIGVIYKITPRGSTGEGMIEVYELR